MILEVIEKIKKRPNIYIGEPSLERLHAFVIGYLICESDAGVKSDDYIIFSNFQKYIQNRFNVQSSLNWAHIIESLYPTKEEAFINFFNFFEEFLNIHY